MTSGPTAAREDAGDMRGKVALVTGGGPGLGRAASHLKAVWLCSDEASFITGQTLAVDGGYAIP